MARGASWDPALEAEVGQAIGREARARGVNVLLSPAINLLRHPAWGRAQETYGEDPLHVGRLGAAFIAGAQREVVASVKHFALNSIEDTRFEVDVQVDERTLREVYLPHFELCVRGAHVGSVMAAYNRVNGAYCAENVPLLRNILKGEWGFRGVVESDWVLGTRSTAGSLMAGLDVEMPAAHHYGEKLLRAVQAGELSEALVDDAVRRCLRVKLAFELGSKPPLPPEIVECHAHQELALRSARTSMVLLKNQGALLPLAPRDLRSLAVVGSLAALENTGDRGSSAVRSSFVISALEGIRDRLGAERVVPVVRDTLRAQDEARIAACDAAVVVVGLTWREEGEKIPLFEGGGDRASLRLSRVQQQLVLRVCALAPRTVVVLAAGSALELRPIADAAPALLLSWYPGMLGGEALADVLFGEVSPSGKLPISFARAAADLVPFGREKVVRYGYDHGYRHLDRAGRPPEFCFGHGLSYTRFRYDALRLDRATMAEGDTLGATVEVTNAGPRAAEEVVQLYLTSAPRQELRHVRSLVGFGRLALAAGQTRRLRMRLGARELSRFDVQRGGFVVDAGEYELRAGPSLAELPLRARFEAL
jgi:beta-glucosidase